MLSQTGWRKSEPFDLVPSGALALQIREGSWTMYELNDSDATAVEDRLNHFIVKLLEKAVMRKNQHDENEARRQAWAEQERLRREEEAREAEEQKKIDQWDQWMTAWKRCQDVRAFATAIREKLSPIEEGSKVAGWLVWAEAYADKIDPLRVGSNSGA